MSLAACENPQLSMAFALDAAVGGARCGGMGMAFLAAVDAAASAEPWLAQQEAGIRKAAVDKDGQFDIWASIQTSKKETDAEKGAPAPYVHPLVKRSASSLSQRSLEICTESLGSETGSEGMFSSDDLEDYFAWRTGKEELVAADKAGGMGGKEEIEEHVESMSLTPPNRRKDLASVNYHCSIGRKSPSRSFPPPLPSLCRRDGPCLSMRRHQRDGRLILEAVPVPSHNYLHARRESGRLVLTFIETTFEDVYQENVGPTTEQVAQQEGEEEAHGEEAVSEEADAEDRGAVVETGVDEDVMDNDVAINEDDEVADEEGEEEVEVVDKGIVVEVKVSRPPLLQSGRLKMQRSSVVINKFVGVPLSNQSPWAPPEQAVTMTSGPPHRTVTLSNGATTTATAVVAVAAEASSSLSTDERYWRSAKGPQSTRRHPSPEKLYFSSKSLINRQELLHQVRSCSERHRSLFIREPCCIATS